MNDHLLPVAEHFDLLPGVAVGGDQRKDQFFEGRIGAKQDGALGRLADADQEITALLEAFACELLDRLGGGLKRNVDIDGGNVCG